MRILAIDPGVRSGVALLDVPNDKTPVLLMHDEVYGGLSGFHEWWQRRPDYDVLVVEDYIVRRGVPGNVEPLRIIGYLHPYAPVLQAPAGRKQAVSDDVLKRLGMYLPGEPNRNAREAVRHGVWWLKKHHHLPTMKAGWIATIKTRSSETS